VCLIAGYPSFELIFWSNGKAIVGAGAHLFRPMYAGANMGHPSDFLAPGYVVHGLLGARAAITSTSIRNSGRAYLTESLYCPICQATPTLWIVWVVTLVTFISSFHRLSTIVELSYATVEGAVGMKIVKDLGAIDAVGTCDFSVQRCRGEHTAARGDEIYPDALPDTCE
jgi:hypothetical protein